MPQPVQVTEADCNEYIHLLTAECRYGTPENRNLALKCLPIFSRAKIAVLNNSPGAAHHMLKQAAELLQVGELV
jgi:hypothetical protein